MISFCMWLEYYGWMTSLPWHSALDCLCMLSELTRWIGHDDVYNTCIRLALQGSATCACVLSIPDLESESWLRSAAALPAWPRISSNWFAWTIRTPLGKTRQKNSGMIFPFKFQPHKSRPELNSLHLMKDILGAGIKRNRCNIWKNTS